MSEDNIFFSLHYHWTYGDVNYVYDRNMPSFSYVKKDESSKNRLIYDAIEYSPDVWDLNELAFMSEQKNQKSFEEEKQREQLKTKSKSISQKIELISKMFEKDRSKHAVRKLEKKQEEEEKKAEDSKEKTSSNFFKEFENKNKESEFFDDEKFEKEFEEKNPLLYQTLEVLSEIKPEKKVDVFHSICAEIQKNYDPEVPIPPEEKSIANDKEEKSVEIITSLKENNTPELFMQTTETSEMVEVMKQIENITGYDLVTGAETPICALKFQSQELNNTLFLQKKLDEIKLALKKDIAEAYGVPAEKVNIRNIIKGSIEVLFSLPGHTNAPNLTNANLPSFRSIMQANGVTNTTIQQDMKLPDPTQAKQLLEQYTTPVLIKTDTDGSELMSKFGKYLAALATLSNNVRIVHKKENNSLEIHGSPSAKGAILAYFAQLEDELQATNPKKIDVITEKPNVTQTSENQDYYPNLWDVLYEKAKHFVTTTYVNPSYTLQTHTLIQNPYLKKKRPAATSFVTALTKKNLHNTAPNDIVSMGVFAWHGTGTDEAVKSIAENNLDPKRRCGQAYGVGEYCADNPSYSQGSFWGNTFTLFVFFILTKNNDYYRFNTHHVTNNPSQNEMYMVPILIATFNNKTPIIQIQNTSAYNALGKNFQWEWLSHDSWKTYGEGNNFKDSSQITIEEMYQKYNCGKALSYFIINFNRLDNNYSEAYKIDFASMKQTNQRTNYVREIRREKHSFF